MANRRREPALRTDANRTLSPPGRESLSDTDRIEHNEAIRRRRFEALAAVTETRRDLLECEQAVAEARERWLAAVDAARDEGATGQEAADASGILRQSLTEALSVRRKPQPAESLDVQLPITGP